MTKMSTLISSKHYVSDLYLSPFMAPSETIWKSILTARLEMKAMKIEEMNNVAKAEENPPLLPLHLLRLMKTTGSKVKGQTKEKVNISSKVDAAQYRDIAGEHYKNDCNMFWQSFLFGTY